MESSVNTVKGSRVASPLVRECPIKKREHIDALLAAIPAPFENLPETGRVIQAQKFQESSQPQKSIVLMEVASKGKTVSFLMPKAGTADKPRTYRGKLQVRKPTSKLTQQKLSMDEELHPVHKEGKLPDDEESVLVYQLPSGSLREMIIKTSKFTEAHFAKASLPKTYPTNLLFVQDVQFFGSDITPTIASIDAVASDANIGLQQGNKLTSIGAIGVGVIQVIKGLQEIETADRIQDIVGKRLGMVRLGRGVHSILAGIVIAYNRISSLAQVQLAFLTGLVAAAVLKFGSMALGVLSYVFASIGLLWNAWNSRKFDNALQAAIDTGLSDKEKISKGLAHLIGNLELTQKEKEQVANIACVEDMGTLYKLVSEEVVVNPEEAAILTHHEKREISWLADEIFKQFPKDPTDEQLLLIGANNQLISDWAQVRMNLTARMMKEWARIKMVKEKQYSRQAGGESLALLKKELLLPPEHRLTNKLNDLVAFDRAKQIIGLAQKEAEGNIKTAVAISGICAIGIVGTVLATIFTAGTNLLIAGIVNLLGNGLMALLDGYFFVDDMKKLGDSNRRERIMIVLFALLAVASIIVGSIFSGGGLPLIAVIIGGVMMLSVYGSALAISFKVEKEAKKRRGIEEDERKQYKGHTLQELIDRYGYTMEKGLHKANTA